MGLGFRFIVGVKVRVGVTSPTPMASSRSHVVQDAS